MQHTIIAILFSLTSAAASAGGFAPWNDHSASFDGSAHDGSARSESVSFYAPGLPSVDAERQDETEVVIVVGPYYRRTS